MEEPQPAPAQPLAPRPAPPVMDVVAAPPTAAPEPKPAPKTPATPPTPAAAPAKPKPPKKAPNQSVNTAIAATVVIVLGLALLAVYAYIKTK